MQWKSLESDLKQSRMADAFRSLDCLSALYALTNFSEGINIYAAHSCSEAVLSHVRSDKNEVGGLLLGLVYQGDVRRRERAEMLILLTHAVPSVDYKHSSVSLTMGTEVWSRIDSHVLTGNIVIGWYHSHPNLGAFFSGTDRKTQRAFFNQPYSLGWVIDPFRSEQKVFCGPESVEYQHSIMEIAHGLEMAESY